MRAFRRQTSKQKLIGYLLICLLVEPWFLIASAHAAFVEDTAARLPVDSDDSYDFAIADVDGTNGPDILVANGGQSRLLLNDGAGNFSDATAARLPAFLHTTTAVAFGDVDGINGPDAFLVGVGQNRLLINDGTGSFSDETALRLPVATDIGMDIALGDIDGDGDVDAIVANRGSRNQIWINDGSGNFSDDTPARLVADADPTYAAALGDINGDGALDIFFGNHGRQNRLFTNNFLGVFSDATANIPAATDSTGDAVMVDVDSDGDNDIASAEGLAGLVLLINDGAGNFANGSTQLPAIDAFGVKVDAGDIDFDGSVDLLLGAMGQDVVLLNDGTGTFNDTTAAELGADDRRSFGVLLADADLDLDLDLLVATPQGQNRYYDNAVAAPRVLTEISPGYIEVTDEVTINVNAFDEDGLGAITTVVLEPDANSVPLGSGTGTFFFTPSQIGLHTVEVTAEDTSANQVVRQFTFLAQANDVSLPTIDTLTVVPDNIVQGESALFTVEASDDRGVSELTLTVDGVAVPLDGNGQATYTPETFGNLLVVAQAQDAAGNVGSSTTNISVAQDLVPPAVTLTALPDPVDITNPINITAQATDNINVTTFNVLVNGPAGGPVDEPIAIDAAGNGSYTPFIPGDYTFTATATDPSGNSTVENVAVTAEGIPDNEAPVVDVTVFPGTTIAGGTVTITVDATDNIIVASRSLEVNGVVLPLDANNQVQFTAPVLGSYTAIANASDPTGNTGSDTVLFSAIDPSVDTAAPVVEIAAPVDDAQITQLSDVVGTVTDLTLVSYELAYAPIGTNNFVPFETGGQQVSNDVLGALDPTMLENGVYEIRLSAQDLNGLISTTSVVVNITGELKLGQFAVSFLDKALNIGRLPLDVTRGYDSRKRDVVGDFGYGWQIETSSAELMENRSPATNWAESRSGGIIPTYFISPTRPHTATIRFSEEDEVRFSGKPVPDSQQLFPIQFLNGFAYEAIGNSTGTLAPNQVPDIFDSFTGTITDISLVDYNPSVFTYTAENNFVYRFAETSFASLRHELTSITDPNGSTITFGNNGFTHSNGLGLTFVRDAQNRITSLTDPNGNVTRYDYDAAGDLVAVTDGEGNATTYVYDNNHYLLEIRDPTGTPLQKQEYDDEGRLIAVTDGAGNRVEMEYDVSANTQIIRDRRANPTIYEYDGAGNITRETSLPEIDGVVTPVEVNRTFTVENEVLTETNGLGVQTAFSYNAKGERLSTTLDVGGLDLTETLTYDARGQVLTSTDPRGNVVTNTYDGNGNQLTQLDRTGSLTTWTYDSDGNVTRQTDPLGNYTAFGYDSVGNKITEERYDLDDNLLRRMTFTYDSNGNKLTETVFVTVNSVLTGLTTTFTYNGNDQVVTVTDPLGRVRTTEYDILNRKVAEVDGLGNRTEYDYTDLDEISEIRYADGTDTVYGFDADGNRSSETNRNTQTTQFTFDALDRITRIELADGSARLKRYDAAGNVIGEIGENGDRTDHEYDAVGRRLRTIQPEVFNPIAGDDSRPVTSYEYDGNGNQIAIVDANGARTEHTYDAENRLLATTFPDGTVMASVYDPVGNEVSKTDPLGNATLFSYDALSRLVSTSLPRPTAGDDRPVTQYVFDEGGRLLSQIDANGRATNFEYDAAGNRTARVLPGGQREQFTYDLENRVLSHTDFNGDTTTFVYDTVGRQTLLTYEDGSSVATTYDGEGRPLTVTDARGVTTIVYDERGQLLSKAGPEGTLSYTYSPTGQQLSVTAPAGVTAYTYDALDRLATVTDPADDVTQYQYDLVGNLVSAEYENGTIATHVYNNRNQLTSLTNRKADDSVISSYAYALNDNGLRTGVTESDGSTAAYVYDDNYRLITETRVGTDAYIESYTYDAVGNRLTAVRDGVSTSYTYDINDRLIAEDAITYVYDGNGNRVSKTEGAVVTNYTYNNANRLVGLGENGVTATQYVYDSTGNRVQERDGAGAVVKNFIVDPYSLSGVAQVLEERNGAGALQVRYSYGHDLASQSQSGTISYYHYDGTGSTRVLTDATEAVTDTYLYDSFGVELATIGTTPNRFRFAGEQYDANSGFYYLRARFYDQNTGVFVSMDPFEGDPQSPISLHRYLYANNNPVNFTDPTGEFSLISISISISISTNIRSIYTTNLVKFFLKAAKIAYCQLAPAYEMQSLALDMIARNLPGGFRLYEQSRQNIAGAFRAIGREIGNTYKNIGNDMVKVNFEIGTDLDDLYDALVADTPYPNSGDLQKLLSFKETLNTWLGRYSDTMLAIDSLSTGDACGFFTALDNQADFLTGLIPSF